MIKKYDVAVIGGGPGGLYAAHEAANHGSVALIEKDGDLGGTCLNRGCIPTKVLITRKDKGDSFEEAAKFRDGLISKLKGNAETSLDNIDCFLNSPAKIKGKNSDGYEIQTDEDPENTIYAKKVIIATGSSPNNPLADKYSSDSIISGEEATKLTTLPESVLIVGGGDIGVELANIYRSYGSKVKIVEYENRILSRTQEEDISSKVHESLNSCGIDIDTSVEINEVTQSDKGVTVSWKNKYESTQRDGTFQKVVYATGRTPNLEKIGLENIIDNYDANKVEIAPTLQIKGMADIYVIGDAAYGGLAHVAEYQGSIAAINAALGKSEEMDLSLVEKATFTPQGIASVGKLEKEVSNSKVKWLNVPELDIDYKLILNDDNIIVGGTAIGTNYKKPSKAHELIHILSVAIADGGKYDQFESFMKKLPDILPDIKKGSIGESQGTKDRFFFAKNSMAYCMAEENTLPPKLGRLEIMKNKEKVVGASVIKGPEEHNIVLYGLAYAIENDVPIEKLAKIIPFHPSLHEMMKFDKE